LLRSRVGRRASRATASLLNQSTKLISLTHDFFQLHSLRVQELSELGLLVTEDLDGFGLRSRGVDGIGNIGALIVELLDQFGLYDAFH
jgi:hypothetical protein